jgi:hypothetical protein
MKRLLRKIDAALAAVAFAEEGDADTARLMLADAGAEPPDARPEQDLPAIPPHVPLAKGSRA